MTRRRSQLDDEEIVVLDSIGTPALSCAVPAAMRLLRSQLDNLRTNRPYLVAHSGVHDATRNTDQQGPGRD